MSQPICFLIIFLTALVACAALYLLKRLSVNLALPRKILALALLAVTFVRYMIAEEAVIVIRGLNMYSIFGDDIFRTVVAVLLLWFSFSAMLNIVLTEFLNAKVVRHMATYFGLPVLILDLVFFDTYVKGIAGLGAFSSASPRLVLICVEIGLSFALILSSYLCGIGRNKDSGKLELDSLLALPNKKELRNLLLILPAAAVAIMPSFTLYALKGAATASLKFEDFTAEHRLILYISVILPYVIYRILKDKTYEQKREALIYISLAFVWAYMRNWTFESLAYPWNWPFHLCNTAMFIVPLCLIFRMKRLFNFTLFINVLGALLAMFMPDISEGTNILEESSVHFWLNHYAAFFMPVLCIALALFARPRFKEWVYSVIAFAGYFVMVLFLNSYFTGIGHETDFFFINSNFIADKLGDWAENLLKTTVTFNIGDATCTIYPVYQALFFLTYIGLSVAVWFVYAILFKSWDVAEDRRLKERDYRKMKKDLESFLGNRNINEPITGDSSPSLVLKNFSKRYGANKHYSVDNVSFEVRGGEVFGFLGPNGAGKSTIIKSVVGIQTITSGNIEVCGYDVDKQSVQSKLNLGFVPDHYALYENLTGREYINYIADLYEVSQEDRDERIEKYVTLFQLTGSFDNQMKTYSHGMKQKIAIMAALVHNPKLWILDEPLTGLDPTSIHEVKECMKAHAEAGNIVFFSSHIIDVVEKICDRIAIIKKGKLRACIKVSELEEQGIDLEQFYLSIINADDEEAVVEEESADDTAKVEAGA